MIKMCIRDRAVPCMRYAILDKRHSKDYPNGSILYLDEYKREMLVVPMVPKHAGQFVVETNCGTSSMTTFQGRAFFKTLEEIVDYLENMENKKVKEVEKLRVQLNKMENAGVPIENIVMGV